MAKRKAERQLAVTGDSGWLSLKDAAQLCNTTSADLRNQIERGKLRAFTVQQGGKTRFRLLRSSLIEAGLIGKAEQPSEPTSASQETRGSVDLLPLIRDQNARISALEDQRAQLAGQLGVALERLRSIDERLSDLETHPETINMYLPTGKEKPNGKGKRGLKKSLLKVVAVTPSPRRWKREAT